MKRLQLIISIRRTQGEIESARVDSPNETDPDLKLEVFEQDRNTCRFCGFNSTRFQDIHILNSDLPNDQLSNLATICTYCSLVLDVDQAGRLKGPSLIWYPEISQSNLNNIARTMLVARRYAKTEPSNSEDSENFSMRSKIEATDQSICSGFRRRQESAVKRFSSCDPATLGRALRKLSDEEYERRDELMSGLRLLILDVNNDDNDVLEPDFIDFLTGDSSPYSHVPPVTWETLLNNAMRE